MKPYSVDLRQKVLDTYLKNKASIRETAERFNVSDSFVRKLIKRHQQTGSIEPKPHSGGASAKLTSEHYSLIEKVVAEEHNVTLAILCERMENQTGIRVSVPTMCRILQRLKLKKNKRPPIPVESQPSETPEEE